MRLLLTCITLICTIFITNNNLYARNGSLQGRVTTADGNPVSEATISIKDLHKSTVTNSDGTYTIEDIPAGSYTITLSAMKLPAQYQEVIIEDDETQQADFNIQEKATLLDEITISLAHSRFSDTASNYVGKMPLKNIELAQVYNDVNKKLISEQMLVDFSEALKNAPGVYKIGSNRFINAAGGSKYTLRGFSTEASMVNGIPSQVNGEYELANVEKIEIFKGPSATLYGGALTTFGGLINIVTKQPQDHFGGEVSFSTGSYGLYRGTADLFGPLNKEKTLLYRINTAYTYQGSFQDAGYRRSFYIAPSLQYNPYKNLTINVDAELYNGEATNPSTIFLPRTRKFIATTPEELNFDWKRSYTSNDIIMKTPALNARALIRYAFSDKWQSQTIVAANSRQSKGFYQYQFMRSGVSDDSLQRTFSWQNTQNTNLGLQQNFIGDFAIAGLRNRLVVGIDYLRQTVNNDISPYIVYDTVVATANSEAPYKQLFAYNLERQLGAATGATDNHSTINLYSAYLSDVLNITDQLLFSAGVRIDRYESKGTQNDLTHKLTPNTDFKQTSVSPKAGLVYQILQNKLSAFANYMNGFSYLAPVAQPLPEYSGILKPQRANQYEGGIKMTLWDNRLNVTASYYDITVNNMTRTEPVVRDGKSYAITIQDGTQRSKGIELELIANPLNGLNIIAGYSYNDSKYTRASADVEGLRPASAGPAHLANGWISYKLTTSLFKGIGLGLGGNYIGKSYSTNTVTTGAFVLPAYTLVNAALFYETGRFNLGVKLNNLTDQLYFTGQGVLNPQMPRNVVASVAVRF